MNTSLTLAIEHARADWLAGAPDAWIRYRACLRQVDTPKTPRADRPCQSRRPLRLRGTRAQA